MVAQPNDLFPSLLTYSQFPSSHECWQAACELIGGTSQTEHQLSSSPLDNLKEATELGDDPQEFAQQALALCKHHVKDVPLWIRPAFDGLVISTDGVKTTDDFYL
jgi:hypothetical protein